MNITISNPKNNFFHSCSHSEPKIARSVKFVQFIGRVQIIIRVWEYFGANTNSTFSRRKREETDTVLVTCDYKKKKKDEYYFLLLFFANIIFFSNTIFSVTLFFSLTLFFSNIIVFVLYHCSIIFFSSINLFSLCTDEEDKKQSSLTLFALHYPVEFPHKSKGIYQNCPPSVEVEKKK